jgi:periplasmic protein CpxP/Spy
MKKVLLMALLMTASIVSMNAQRRAHADRTEGEQGGNRTPPTAQEMADKETARETKMLNLTPEQVEKVKTINLNYSQQRLDAMSEAKQTKDRTAMENKMQGIRLAQDNELKTILTPEQQAKLTKAHSAMGQEHGGGTGKGDWKNRQKGQQPSGTPNGAPQGMNNN